MALGLPVLDAMCNRHGTAFASGEALPTRYGVWFFAGGLNDGWAPASTGALALPPPLAPLASFKSHLTMISGLQGPSFGDYSTNRHIMGTAGGLSGWKPNNGAFGGPSIDHLVSQALKGAEISSLQVGVSPGLTAEKGTGWENISQRGPDQPNPAEFDPAKIMARLFGDTKPSVPAVDEAPLRLSYLSAVREDANQLAKTLGQHDKILLDSYLSGLADVERSINKVPSGTTPAICATKMALTGEGIEARSKDMAKLLAAALACNKTRVFAFEFTKPNAFVKYPNMPDSHHNMGHVPQHARIGESAAFIMQRFADLLAAMRDVPEGAGTLLDNVAVLVQSDTSWDHRLDNMVAIIAGRASGALKGNTHVRSTGPITRAALTAARACGANLASVGTGDGLAKDSIAEVLA